MMLFLWTGWASLYPRVWRDCSIDIFVGYILFCLFQVTSLSFSALEVDVYRPEGRKRTSLGSFSLLSLLRYCISGRHWASPLPQLPVKVPLLWLWFPLNS